MRSSMVIPADGTSAGIEVTNFRVPDVRFSDHRPIVCDFEVDPDALGRKIAA